MECSQAPEPAYLNLPGWRCIPVYAMPLSPNSKVSPADSSQPPLEAHNLLPSAIPRDPRQWSRQNVYSWLEWCIENFSLPPLDVDHFHMNGRGLCLLKKSDWCDRAPGCGDVLYNALQILMNNSEKMTNSNGGPPNNISASLIQHAAQEKNLRMGGAWPRSISSDFHSMGHVIHESELAQVAITQLNGSDVDSTTANSPPPTHEIGEKSLEKGLATDKEAGTFGKSSPQALQFSPFKDVAVENSVEKINVRLLWDFLQQLLNDSQQRYNCCIVWKDKKRGVFKITDPHHLAALWGKQKNHLNMNFDKMSRALRYYYRVRILQKEPGERHCYRFLRHPNELRHCKQRALLIRDSENVSANGSSIECPDIEAALDMSIKEEGSSPGDAE